jgi:hypothetical protein
MKKHIKKAHSYLFMFLIIERHSMVGRFMGSQQEEACDAHEAQGVSLLVSKGGYG